MLGVVFQRRIRREDCQLRLHGGASQVLCSKVEGTSFILFRRRKSALCCRRERAMLTVARMVTCKYPGRKASGGLQGRGHCHVQHCSRGSPASGAASGVSQEAEQSHAKTGAGATGYYNAKGRAAAPLSRSANQKLSQSEGGESRVNISQERRRKRGGRRGQGRSSSSFYTSSSTASSYSSFSSSSHSP